MERAEVVLERFIFLEPPVLDPVLLGGVFQGNDVEDTGEEVTEDQNHHQVGAHPGEGVPVAVGSSADGFVEDRVCGREVLEGLDDPEEPE